MVDPERLQRFGVERLDRTVGKSDEHHAIGIGRRRDGKARRAIHFGLRQDLAGNRVDAADHIPRADDQNAVHQQRAAGRAAVYAAADRIRPVKRGRVGIHRHLDRYDGVVAACDAAGRAIGVIARSAEIGPFGGKLPQRFVLLRSAEGHCGAGRAARNDNSVLVDFQNERTGCAVRRFDGPAPARIAGAGQQVLIGIAIKQLIRAVCIRPDACFGERIADKHQRVRGRQLRREEDRLRLAHLEPVLRSRFFARKVICQRQRDSLRLRRAVQLHIGSHAGRQLLSVHPDAIAGAAVIAVAGGIRRIDLCADGKRLCSRGHGDGIVPHRSRIARAAAVRERLRLPGAGK